MHEFSEAKLGRRLWVCASRVKLLGVCSSLNIGFKVVVQNSAANKSENLRGLTMIN